MDEIENLLREFGLTEYEIRAYINLLKLREATAEQISEIGNIPLPRVYDTLVELQKKGFVLISKGRPKRFKFVSPQKALNELIESREKQFDKSIKNLKELAKNTTNLISKIQPTEKKEEGKKYEVWSIEKRKNIVKILDEQKELAKKEILIFSGDLSWINETMKIIKKAIKNDVEIRAIAHEPENEIWSKNIELARKLGINIKTGYKGLMRGHIIDNKIVSIATKQSSKGVNVAGDGLPGSDSINQYELMTSDNPVLVKSLKENFEFWWNKLK